MASKTKTVSIGNRTIDVPEGRRYVLVRAPMDESMPLSLVSCSANLESIRTLRTRQRLYDTVIQDLDTNQVIK